MEDAQTAVYPGTYGFDLDMMKRSIDAVGGPDPKKARWSPASNSFPSQASPTRDAFANYGYGPQAAHTQLPPPSPLYSTGGAPLSINTQNPQLSPNPNMPGGFAAQQAQASPVTPYGPGFGGYGMMGMGMPGMFQYGQFQQRVPSLNMPVQSAPYSPILSSALASTGFPTSPLLSGTGLTPQSSGLPSGMAGGMPNRTVYIGNLPATASVDELLNLVHFGPLESIRVLPEKSCVFLSFLDSPTATAFHADATIKKLTLHGQELKIGWGKPSPVPAQVQLAIQQSNASRNVYLGNLDPGMTEESLRDDLSRFGLIDQVKIVRDKNIGFIHFLSISVATKVVNTLPTEVGWAGKRVNYGKDRCAYVPKSQQVAQQQAQAAAAQSLVAQSAMVQAAQAQAQAAMMAQVQAQHAAVHHHQQQQQSSNGSGGASPSIPPSTPGGPNSATGQVPNTPGTAPPFSPYSPFTPSTAGGPGGMDPTTLQQAMAAASAMNPMGPMGMGFANLAAAAGAGTNVNRTVYLGNIHPETTTEDLCNAIRGGVLQSIRYMQDKHIAFVTFVDPAAAYTFFQVATYHGLTLNNRRVKIGWGKASGPLPPALALAVHSGATRNVYIGNVEDFDTFNDERLKRDFGEYGEIELVNFLKEKNCAFVNFTNISNAIKAIEGIKNKPEYANLRVAHGKDRCANPPRSGLQGSGGGPGGGNRRQGQGQGQGGSRNHNAASSSHAIGPGVSGTNGVNGHGVGAEEEVLVGGSYEELGVEGVGEDEVGGDEVDVEPEMHVEA